ncbi:GSCFA domain-containing protein [Aureitalea sp. L0-47]|uniref:GSCFA domain-containing protein n=1 Tax=Aureitalea sp. L0-47 TaxID=2816962 RepID=UPI002237AB16|nr:GSCFA domain-containing protein [Aureitalea sp. L0-47]MCW5520011.1 GSCFA domain-containing protein [Aureitalea sp. L0-47]
MKLQTQIPFSSEANQIDYQSKTILLGSCFTEHIGAKLDYFKFQNVQNPFGIIFHPIALERLIARAIQNKTFVEKDIFERDGNWHCLEVHSLLSHVDKQEYIQLLNDTLDKLRSYLESASHLLITFGTVWGYRYVETDAVVANCHKIPQSEFRKELLSVSEVTTTCQNIVQMVSEFNAEVQIVFTVSPVRHLKDGFIENMRSKAHLISGIHRLIDTMDKGTAYFPSYELMMDELRDYRFYSEDMLHPNQTAIEVIWDRFSKVWIHSSTEVIRKEIAKIQSGLSHRPFHPESPSHKAFEEQLQQKIEQLQARYPHIRF